LCQGRTWAGVINQLLTRRNAVAHGSERAGLDEKDYTNLEQAVNLVMDELVKALTEAIAGETFRRLGCDDARGR
jgi:MAE_28990/MAE_18760-like HEPN